MSMQQGFAGSSHQLRPDTACTIDGGIEGSATSGIGRVISTVGSVTLRNPFAVTQRSLTLQAYVRAYRNRDRWSWKIFELFRRIAPLNKARASVTFDDGAREFWFDAANTQFHSVYLKRYQSGYEVETCQLLEMLLRPTDTFYDIGSNWGHLSVYVASIPGYRGHIHAFEPAAVPFRDLVRTVNQLGLDERVSCHNVACSDAAGLGQMIVGDGLHSGLAQLEELKDGTAVTVISLDDSGLPPPQVIKLDVEGAEHRVLSGAQRMIETARPFIIFEAWTGTNTMAAARLLRDLGYTFFWPCLATRHHDDTSFTVAPHGEVPDENDIHLILYPWDLEYRNLFHDWFNAFACPVERVDWVASRFADGAARNR